MNGPTLGSVLFAVDSNGKRLHTDEEVTHALPWLVMLLELPPDAVPKDLQAGFEATLAGFGVTGADTAVDMATKVAKGYQTQPLAPRLVAAVDAWARALLAEAGRPPEEQQKLAAFLGSNAKAGGVLGGGTRPQGSTAAGPLARFAVNKPGK